MSPGEGSAAATFSDGGDQFELAQRLGQGAGRHLREDTVRAEQAKTPGRAVFVVSMICPDPGIEEEVHPGQLQKQIASVTGFPARDTRQADHLLGTHLAPGEKRGFTPEDFGGVRAVDFPPGLQEGLLDVALLQPAAPGAGNFVGGLDWMPEPDRVTLIEVPFQVA